MVIEFGGRCQRRVAAVFVLGPLEGVAITFARSDAQRMIDRDHEDFAVADLAGSRGFRDSLDGLVRDVVRDGRLNSNLGHKFPLIFRAPVNPGMALLAANAFTSVTVMPLIPAPASASRTALSFNGLIMAVMSFMRKSRMRATEEAYA